MNSNDEIVMDKPDEQYQKFLNRPKEKKHITNSQKIRKEIKNRINKLFTSKKLECRILERGQVSEEGWGKLNSRWAYFFIFLAFLNEVVWRTQPEATWVNFKVWGMLPITIIFTAVQLPLINRYKL